MSNEGRLTSEQKRLIALLVSASAGCRYCQAHTALAASRYGASPERIAALWDFRYSALFSVAERAAFEFALATASAPVTVEPVVADELRAHWDEGEVVEILSVVALFGFLNRWNDAIGTTIEPAARAHAEVHLGAIDWVAGKHQ